MGCRFTPSDDRAPLPDRRCWSGVFRLVLSNTRLCGSDRACNVPPVTVAQLEKFKTRAKGRSVADDRYDANRPLCERKIHLYWLAYFQVALHQRPQATFADIQADGVKRVWGRPRQLPKFKRYAEERPLVFSRTYRRARRHIFRCSVHCSAHNLLIHLPRFFMPPQAVICFDHRQEPNSA